MCLLISTSCKFNACHWSWKWKLPAVILCLTVIQLPRGYAAPIGPVPINVTIQYSTPYAVCVTWQLTPGHGLTPAQINILAAYRPVSSMTAGEGSFGVLADYSGQQMSAVLGNLHPSTQYRLVMTSSVNGSLIGSSPVVFFHTPSIYGAALVPSSYHPPSEVLTFEEISIIIIVMCVWVMAIMLFFNRWGKIRMLEPYEYHFKYHHPVPEVAGHDPSCPLADRTLSPLLRTSLEKPCSLEYHTRPLSRRCSSLSTYFIHAPSLNRTDSDPSRPDPTRQHNFLPEVTVSVNDLPTGDRACQSSAQVVALVHDSAV